MYPFLLEIGPVAIPTYGFMLAVGVAFGFWFLFIQAKKQGLNAPKVLDAAFFTIIISLIGAKLILFLGSFSYYTNNPRELFSLARSGGVFQGGLAFGIIFALLYFRKHKIPTWKAADIIGPALALGHGFGRIGCFLAGCCYGTSCSLPWAVTFQSKDAPGIPVNELGILRHPTQLYESALNFLNFFVLFLILRKKKFDGQVFSLYIINYSILRYFVEFYRFHEDSVFLIQNSSPYLRLSFPQLFCILGLISGVALFLIMRKRKSA